MHVSFHYMMQTRVAVGGLAPVDRPRAYSHPSSTRQDVTSQCQCQCQWMGRTDHDSSASERLGAGVRRDNKRTLHCAGGTTDESRAMEIGGEGRTHVSTPMPACYAHVQALATVSVSLGVVQVGRAQMTRR